MRINSVCRDQYLRNHNHVIFIYGTSFVVLMYKMTISLGFFSYFQNFDFLDYQGGGGVKWQKIAQNLWFPFVVHKCKMISPGVFVIFPKFWFFGLLEGQRAKNGPKWQKTLSFALYITGTKHDMILLYGTHVWKDNISRSFFTFFPNFYFRGQ